MKDLADLERYYSQAARLTFHRERAHIYRVGVNAIERLMDQIGQSYPVGSFPDRVEPSEPQSLRSIGLGFFRAGLTPEGDLLPAYATVGHRLRALASQMETALESVSSVEVTDLSPQYWQGFFESIVHVSFIKDNDGNVYPRIYASSANEHIIRFLKPRYFPYKEPIRRNDRARADQGFVVLHRAEIRSFLEGVRPLMPHQLPQVDLMLEFLDKAETSKGQIPDVMEYLHRLKHMKDEVTFPIDSLEYLAGKVDTGWGSLQWLERAGRRRKAKIHFKSTKRANLEGITRLFGGRIGEVRRGDGKFYVWQSEDPHVTKNILQSMLPYMHFRKGEILQLLGNELQ